MLRTSHLTAALALALAAGAQANPGAEPVPAQTPSASTPAASDIEVFIEGSEAARAALAAHPGRPLVLKARRVFGSGMPPEEAFARVDATLAELARKQGLQVADAGAAPANAITVELDSGFYVYTSKFNARRVLLAEISAAAQQPGGQQTDGRAENRGVDVLRVVAGAVGIMNGWISPTFGSYMMGSGVTPALFGNGKAPTRLFAAGKDRYERGEQEAGSFVTVALDGQRHRFTVRTVLQGDKPPFAVDPLVGRNLETVMAVLDPKARLPQP
ncbi:hypothetical protein [Azohydromonas aeria]|uniref:hypothetical protein n=1 Tax=Azohydromonas aeria TaxID=2590212 RepID=UPI0012FCC82B|nr:hypothetical protein [Azohydromonas aeria]